MDNIFKIVTKNYLQSRILKSVKRSVSYVNRVDIYGLQVLKAFTSHVLLFRMLLGDMISYN